MRKARPSFLVPPGAVTLTCLVIDAVFIAALLSYYGTLTHLSAMERISAGASLPARAINFGVFLGAFWILPVLIYTLFKAVKIQVFSTGAIGLFSHANRLFLVNLVLGLAGFLDYAVFELLGQGLRDPVSVPASLAFLVVSFTVLGLWTMLAHAALARPPYPGAIEALTSPLHHWLKWKASLPYILAGAGALALVNIVPLLAPQTPPPWAITGLAGAGLLLSLAVMNAYQWRIYDSTADNRNV